MYFQHERREGLLSSIRLHWTVTSENKLNLCTMWQSYSSKHPVTIVKHTNDEILTKVTQYIGMFYGTAVIKLNIREWTL